jgi:hypothetical protein
MSGEGDRTGMDDRTGGGDTQPPQLVTFDAILPPAMALRAEETDIKRVNTDLMTRFVLSVLAGAFIAFGAIFATTVMAGNVEVASMDGAWTGYARLPYAGASAQRVGFLFGPDLGCHRRSGTVHR